MPRDHNLRMGLLMPYTLKAGSYEANFPKSFWCASVSRLDAENQIAQALYRGWADIATYNAGLPPLPGAEKAYQFDGPAFNEILMTPTSLPAGSPMIAEMLKVINERAIAQKDQPGVEGELISFFENAAPATS